MKNYIKNTINFYNCISENDIKKMMVPLESKLNDFIEMLFGTKILDAGCGPGHDTNYFTKKGLDCLGIDFSEKMLDYAKKNFKGEFQKKDLLNLNFEEGTFDGIWNSACLMHISRKDIKKVLSSFFNILDEKGVLGIMLPIERNKEKKKDKRICIIYKPEEIKSYLIDIGFKIKKSEIFLFNKKKWLFLLAIKK